MRNYLAFLKKELIEGIRAYKMVILVVVFLIFGVMNPLVAKLTPALLDSLSAEGMSLTLADPSALDSWEQFFKNVSQMGFIILVILFSGILAHEYSKGTLINMLTKGLSRTTVIVAKYSALILAWSLAYLVCLLVTWAYTVYLFPDNNAANLAPAIGMLWLFGVLLISVLILAAALTKNSYACLLGVALFVGVLMVISIFPDVFNYNPLSLASVSSALMKDAFNPTDLLPAIFIALALSAASLGGAIIGLRHKQL